MHSIDPEKIDGLECALSASGVRRGKADLSSG